MLKLKSYERFLKSSISTTLLACIGIVILLQLGFWQLRRNKSQTRKHERIQQQLDQEPINRIVTPDIHLWQRVSLKGTYEDGMYFVEGRNRWSVPGYDVLQVFNQSDSHVRILVNRGWIPLINYQNRLDRITRNNEEQELQGIVQDIPGDLDSQPLEKNDLEPQRWPFDNYYSITRIEKTLPVLIFSWEPESVFSNIQPSEGIIPHEKPKLKQLTHFEYALTWFVIAFLLFIHIFIPE
jgi:cytochrome oxidase assembly protein ShyY1